jgi:electron transfer flavoprotein alpha subunit
MSVLVLAELSDGQIAPATRNAVTAAIQIDSDVHLLVAGGEGSGAAAAAGGNIAGVTKVLHAEDAVYANGLAENVAKLVAGLASGYSHVLATATNQGKNVMPRAAALLDAMQISEITEVKSPDTFVRPIYAGNALATVKSTDTVKVITVRATGFDAAPATGGSAAVESVASAGDAALSSFVSRVRAPGTDPGWHHRLWWPRHGLRRELQHPGGPG